MLIEPNPYNVGCTISYRVLYAETDRMNVVYYANYLIYFERIRNELIRLSAQSYLEVENAGLLLPVTEVAAEYHDSARYDDLLEMHGYFGWLQGSRFRVNYEIRREETLIVTGHTVHTTISRDGNSRRIPKAIVERFANEAKGPPPD